MSFLFGALFKKHFDSAIRNKYIYIFTGLFYFIFIAFVTMDFLTPDKTENYNRSARIFFPPEFSKRLILFELISFMCIMPFYTIFSFTLLDDSKYDVWATFAGYNPFTIIIQKLLAVLIFYCDFLITLTIVLLISISIYHDSTWQTVLLAQGTIGLLIALFISFTAFLCIAIRKKEMVLLITSALIIGCSGSMHIIGSWLELFNNPRQIINFMLAINPFTLLSGIINYDIMRSWFFYNTSQAVMFRFDYADTVPAITTIISIILILYVLNSSLWNRKIVRPITRNWVTDKSAIEFPQPSETSGSVTALIGPDEQALETGIALLISMLSSKNKKNSREVAFTLPVKCECNDSVDKYLSFFANLYNLPWQQRKQRVTDIITFCELQDVRFTPINKLSQSQYAMLRIAQSLIHSPSSIVWHQVVTCMNQHYRQRMLNIAKTLAQQGTKIFITTTVPDICLSSDIDHIVGFKDGSFTINTSQSNVSSTMLEAFWQ